MRELLKVLLLTILICSFVVVPFSLFGLFRQDVGLATTIQIIPLIFPYFAGYVLPFSILFATVLCYGRLSADNEFGATQAGGVWPGWVCMPAIMLGLVATMTTIYLNESVLTYSTRKISDILIRDRVNLLEKKLNQEGVVQMGSRHLYRFKEDEHGRRPIIMTEFSKEEGKKEGALPSSILTKRIVALDHKVEVRPTGDGKSSMVWLDLINASVVSWKDGKPQPDPSATSYKRPFTASGKIKFSISANRVACWGISELLHKMKEVRQRRELTLKVDAGDLSIEKFREQMLVKKIEAYDLDTRLLQGMLSRPEYDKQVEHLKEDLDGPISQKDFRKSFNKYRRELHSRLALSFSCFLFAFIGALLGLSKQRGARSERFAVGFTVAAVYFIVFLLCRRLADFGGFVLWMPDFALAAVVIYYWRKLFWVV
jgi:lipopolysaccharide export LptBFGC system permease protein LptF